MKTKCPNKLCNKQDYHIIKHKYEDEETPSLHMQCIKCNRNFNVWLCDIKTIKKIFGESYSIYS